MMIPYVAGMTVPRRHFVMKVSLACIGVSKYRTVYEDTQFMFVSRLFYMLSLLPNTCLVTLNLSLVWNTDINSYSASRDN